MITSRSNAQVKYVRRLLAERRFRYEEEAFVVEGTRWMRELAAGRMPERQVDFATLRTLVGFDAYDRLLDAYAMPADVG